MVHDADATDLGATRPGYSAAVTLSVSRQNPGPIFLVLEPILLRFRHFEFRRNVGRAAHSPHHGFLERELPDAAVRDTALTREGTIDERDAFDHAHVRSDAKARVVGAVFVEVARLQIVNGAD